MRILYYAPHAIYPRESYERSSRGRELLAKGEAVASFKRSLLATAAAQFCVHMRILYYAPHAIHPHESYERSSRGRELLAGGEAEASFNRSLLAAAAAPFYGNSHAGEMIKIIYLWNNCKYLIDFLDFFATHTSFQVSAWITGYTEGAPLRVLLLLRRLPFSVRRCFPSHRHL